MNINNIQSYEVYSYSGEFHFQEIRKNETADQTDSSETMMAMLYEFQVSIRTKTVGNLVEQSSQDNPEGFFYPDVSGLASWDESVSGLSQADAAALIGEDGFFGVSKTAARIAEFVLKGAGGDLEKLRAGREGVLKGLKEAEQVWGGTLPDISYDTIENALGAIDLRIEELGGSVVSYYA